MTPSPYLSIIIPIYNEEKILKKRISKLYNDLIALSDSFELIAIENGSHDKSYNVLQNLSQDRPFLKIIKIEKPSYGLALKTGYLKSHGSIIGNFSIDWIDIGFLKKALVEIKKAPIILASKRLSQSQDYRNSLIKIGGTIFHILIKNLFQITVHDTHGIRLIKRKDCLELIKKSDPKSETFETEFIIRATQKKIPIIELPINLSDVRPPRIKVIKRVFTGLWQLMKLKQKINQEK